MRVLQVHNRYRQAGGEDTVVEAEARLLGEAGHEVVAYQVDNPADDLRAIGSLAVAPWNPAVARRVRSLTKEADVAHVHNTWFSLSPSVMAALDRSGVPVVMTLHNYRLMCVNAQLFRDGSPCQLCVGSHPWQGVRFRCYRDSYLLSAVAASTIAVHRVLRTWDRHVRLFISPTGFARERLVRAGLPPDRILVKPHYVEDPGPRSSPPSTSRRVLFAGRLTAEKGLSNLLDAWERSAPDLDLLIVGDGPLRRDLETRRVPRVTFAGLLPREEVGRLLLGSRALVFPSLVFETFGLAVVEALAAGLPVIASDIAGIPELLGPNASGRLVPPGDPRGWSEALQGLVDDDLVNEWGAAGRRAYELRYSRGPSLEALEAIYQVAVGARPEPLE